MDIIFALQKVYKTISKVSTEFRGLANYKSVFESSVKFADDYLFLRGGIRRKVPFIWHGLLYY